MTQHDIAWREPDDYWNTPFYPEGKAYRAVLLVETDRGYETILVMGRDGLVFADAPLGDFAFGDFNPTRLKRWALIDWTIEEHPFW